MLGRGGRAHPPSRFRFRPSPRLLGPASSGAGRVTSASGGGDGPSAQGLAGGGGGGWRRRRGPAAAAGEEAGGRPGEAPAGRVGLLDLPWEDVLVPLVLPRLPLPLLLRAQRVSRAFRTLVRLHLAALRTFRASQAGPHLPKAAFCVLLKDNEVLQQLALQDCSAWLSDTELLPVLSQNHHLQHIELSGCAQLSRQTLVAISLSCPRLRHLALAHCEWVDSLSLRSLADHCKELEALDLTACRQLKDDAICYLAQRCPGLKSLSLAVNANVGDAAVEEVAKGCPGLEQLDLTGCLRVKNDSIRTLAEYCPKLKALKVKHCHDVVESSLSVLRSRGVELDVEAPMQLAVVLLQGVVGYAPFINLQI
ncbi:F-box/LRR-repeat protein 15 [Heteronotia binoei]|uniref:F-box/LRR-repeat protein 15 n=1 Tax=Heteronotia binoei TaxID=13085 RepID=UPI0029306E53|nr:F-box/LRR-repeat protein 15 [Heteronotia binoei]